MPKYSVATTKDKLSNLIDKALAGEEVIITRRGKPAVELRAVQEQAQTTRSQQEWMDWLKERREARPKVDITSLELKRLEEEDYRY